MKVDLVELLKEQTDYVEKYEAAKKRCLCSEDDYSWRDHHTDYPTVKWNRSDLRRTRILLNKLLVRKGY